MMIIKSETQIEIPYEDGLVAKINIIDSPRGKLLGIIEGTSPYYLIKAIYNNTKIKSFMHLKYLENIKKGENKPLPEELFSVLNASPIHKEIILASGRELYPILKSEVIIGDDCSSIRILSLADCLASIGDQVQKSFGPNEHIKRNINYGLEILHMNNNFAGEKPYYNSVFGKIYEL